MRFKYSACLLFVSLLFSCEQEETMTKVSVDQITYGDCKTGNLKSTDSERIEYKTVDNNYLQFNHINAVFNCEPGELIVNVEIINDRIIIEEREEQALANCICLYDLCYRIGPMNYDKYLLTIRHDGANYAEFSIKFNSSTSGVFEIH